MNPVQIHYVFFVNCIDEQREIYNPESMEIMLSTGKSFTETYSYGERNETER